MEGCEVMVTTALVALPDICQNLPAEFSVFSNRETARTPRIYFLMCDGDVVYVGQTQRRWPQRIAQHLLDGEKEFDAVWHFRLGDLERLPREWSGGRWVVGVDATVRRLLELESLYIAHFKPHYNKTNGNVDSGPSP